MALKGRGAGFSLIYATMQGFRDETISSATIDEFNRLVQSPPNFTSDGVARAVSVVCNDADVMCQGPTLDLWVYGATKTENLHLKPFLDPFQKAVRQVGARAVFSASSFDLASFLKTTSISRRENDLQAILSKLDEKRSFLEPLLLRARAKGRNQYGDVDHRGVGTELERFVSTYFNESNLHFFGSHPPLDLCFWYVESWLDDAVDGSTMPPNGIDFEYWCADRIAEQGWKVRVSKASGDQGVDIEAMREGVLVAVQCKRYGQPIGNKSVQEAYTGAAHYQATKAVVIGTGGFTKAAFELAETTGVVLIDAENISAFTNLVMSDRA